MRRLLLLAGVMVLAMALMSPAAAITRGGELDDDDHPYVGLMVAADFEEGALAGGWRCSGTLVSETVFVTAGHCTEGLDPAEDFVFVWMRSDLEPDPSVWGYPFDFAGIDSVTGTAYTHPAYLPNAFFWYDLGVVVLDEAIELDTYAELPSAGEIDDYLAAEGKGRKKATVTAVGYGLQKAVSNPSSPPGNPDNGPLPSPVDIAKKTRYQADLMIVDTRGVAGIGSLPDSNSIILSGDAKHGGTCFGDSGGPGLIGDTLVAVNSFGLNGNCAGIGGMFRIDRQIELDWISTFLD
jgi:hypothetical protein